MARSTVRLLSAAALKDSAGLLDRIVAALVALEPADFYDDASQADLREAARAGVEALLSCLAGRVAIEDASEPARIAGRRQVQQDLPLEGVLRAYRVAGQVIWDSFVATARSRGGSAAEELLGSASELWTVLDGLSDAVSAAYRAEENLLRKRDDRVQESILAALLDGKAASPEYARDAARALGLGPDDRLLCVVGLAPEPGAPALDAPRERLRAADLVSVWMSTAAGECGLVVLGRTSTTTVRGVLAPAVRGRVGMSPSFTALADLPRAQRLAEVAARSSLGKRRVALLEDDLAAALASDSPLVSDVVWERTIGALLRQAGADGAMLLETVTAFLAADASLNVAATEAFVHRNTMMYRLNKVERLTGVPLRELSGQLLWMIGLKEQQLRARR